MNPRDTQRKLAALALALALAPIAACSIGNISRDDCVSNEQCIQSFGPGSTCVAGLCDAPVSGDCKGKDAEGRACFSCPPKKAIEFKISCTNAACAPFDNAKRLTKLTPGGGLPPLP